MMGPASLPSIFGPPATLGHNRALVPPDLCRFGFSNALEQKSNGVHIFAIAGSESIQRAYPRHHLLQEDMRVICTIQCPFAAAVFVTVQMLLPSFAV